MSGFSGACSCGAVTYKAATSPRRIVNCHCNMCRKLNGSAFSSYLAMPRKELLVHGEEHLAKYAVTKHTTKHYCKECGSPLFNLNEKYPGAVMLYLGSAEQPESFVPSVNTFCENMLGWIEQINGMQKLAKEV